MYRLTIRKQAIKALQRMPAWDARHVRDELEKLTQDPDRRDIDVTRLQGRPGFRLRVGGWRVIFMRDDKTREINVLRIGSRGGAYRRRAT